MTRLFDFCVGCAGYHKLMVCAVLAIVTFFCRFDEVLFKFGRTCAEPIDLTCDVSSEESLSECEELENSNDASDGPSSR